MATRSVLKLAQKSVPTPGRSVHRHSSFAGPLSRPQTLGKALLSDSDLGVLQRASLQTRKLPVLSLVSACVEVNALVQKFEVLAGRAAMVGVATAAATELLTERSLFYNISGDAAQLYLQLGVACVFTASALAVSTSNQLGDNFKEAVISSLTAVQRSAASVTQSPVDKAVDYCFDHSVDTDTLYKNSITALMNDDLY